MSLLRVVAVWTGFGGAPGFSDFYITNAGLKQTAVDNGAAGVRAFFDAIKGALPGVQIQVQQEVQELDTATGALIGIENTSTLLPVVNGSATASGPAPVGAVVSWSTNGVNRGRRVRGRTFIVPLNDAAFDGTGSLTTTTVNLLSAAATALRTSAAYEINIWSRPRSGAGGAAFPIESSHVPDMAAVLRSRRD